MENILNIDNIISIEVVSDVGRTIYAIGREVIGNRQAMKHESKIVNISIDDFTNDLVSIRVDFVNNLSLSRYCKLSEIYITHVDNIEDYNAIFDRAFEVEEEKDLQEKDEEERSDRYKSVTLIPNTL